MHKLATDSKLKECKILWFNPLFTCKIKLLPKLFFMVLESNSPPYHRYYLIFNKATEKISYSTTPNLRSIIVSINKFKIHFQAIMHTRTNNGHHFKPDSTGRVVETYKTNVLILSETNSSNLNTLPLPHNNLLPLVPPKLKTICQISRTTVILNIAPW